MPVTVDPSTLFGFGAPTEAIAYLESKGFDASVWSWFDIAAEAHARTFTVAKATRMDVLQSIRDALIQAKAEGGGERAFVNQLIPELQRLGWWGKQVVVDSQGNAEKVQLGSPRRLRTIYRTNVASAYNAARYQEQIKNAADRPYWMYVAVMDARTRPSHAAMNGRVFRYDDPIWQTHYPPCAFNCRCRVRTLSEAEVKRRGIEVESSDGHLETIQVEAGVNKRTGEVVTMQAVRWSGTDALGRPVSMTPAPGFGANPALVPWQPNVDLYDYDIARWYVQETLKGPAFARTWEQIDTAVAAARRSFPNLSPDALGKQVEAAVVRKRSFPVAVLSPDERQLLDVTTQTVLLSDETLLKQAISRTGQDFGLADYWQVQPTIESAQVVVREGGNVLIFVRRGASIYYAVVKRTRDGRELYLTSFRPTNERGIRQALVRGEVLRNELDPARDSHSPH